jgi:vitamin B12 transporter
MVLRRHTRALRAACAAGVFVACSARALAAAPSAPTTASAPAPSPSPSSAPSRAPGTNEIGRVFTSDRTLEATADTTRPTFVIDRATIESAGARTIADALAAVPGMTLFPYGAFGAQVNDGIRGTTSAETLVLQDGVPIAAGSNGTVDLGSLSTAGVQRIEVVESAASTLYGSSATGGVINIITTGAAPQPFARVSGGTYGDWDVAAQAGTGNLAVTYERHTAANVFDYPAFAYPGGNATPAGTRTNDDAQQTVVRLSYLARLGADWSARLAATSSAISIGTPGDLSYPTLDARQGTNRTDALLDLGHTAGAGTYTLTLSGVTQQLRYLDVPDLGGEQNTFDARAHVSLRYAATGTRTDLVTGIDGTRDSAELTFPPLEQPPAAFTAAQSQAAAYVQAGYDATSNVRLIAGVRGENDGPQGSVLAPSFGTRIAFGALRFTANVSESFEAPTLVDLYYPGYSNPNLVPEKLTNYDATIGAPTVAAGITVGFFGRNGSNLIVLDPTTYVPYNASHIAVNGAQLTLATRPLHHVRVNASITDLYRALDTTSGLRLPSTPPLVATLGIVRDFEGGRLAFGATVRVVGSSPDVPNPSGGAPLADPYDAYTTANAYLRYHVSPFAVLSVRGQNLGNERYAPIFGYPVPGRTLQIELATR